MPPLKLLLVILALLFAPNVAAQGVYVYGNNAEYPGGITGRDQIQREGALSANGAAGVTGPANTTGTSNTEPYQAPLSPTITNRSWQLGNGGANTRPRRDMFPQTIGPPPAGVGYGYTVLAPTDTQPQERAEFQDFILQSAGRDLPIFGANLFRSGPWDTYAPVEDIPVTSDYVLGPGDEILIRAWGQIDVDYSATVDRNGNISVPKVGLLTVAGIKYQDLNAYLKTAFGRVFRNFEINASLGQLRSIRIFVVGQAKRPGTYTVSSLSTLVTALFATGGPSVKGSLRNIQLRRGNKTVADFDLYDLLISGDKSKDAPLQPGDVIYIPPVGQLVAINGSVNTPSIFEMKPNAPLSDLIRAAGGLAATAQGQKVTVERIEDRKVRKVEEFTLDNAGLSRSVRDGDLVTVFSIAPRFDNTVTLRGNVAQQGRFPWHQGMRIKDLLPSKEALLSRDYWNKRNQSVGLTGNVANILRQQDFTGTNLSIQDLNQRPRQGNQNDATIAEILYKLQLESEASRFLEPLPAAVSGQLSRLADSVVGDPSKLEQVRLVALRLINQIRPPQREINWDYAVIERVNSNDLATSLVPFNLGKAILENDPTQNLLLQPGDVITIFSKEDIRVPASRQTKYIRLEGEFSNSGVYQILPGETLRQLVSRIGGLAQQAYLFGGEFTRESTRIQQQKNWNDALNRLERDIQRTSITRAQNASEDAATLKQQTDSQQALILRLRQIGPTGRIVLGFSEDAMLKDIPDLALEDGDRFYIPPLPSMVNVFGAVYNENSFIYRQERRVSDYLGQAGGPTKDADERSIYVLRADGSVISARQSGFLSGLLLSSLEGKRLMPGDSIVVPEELDKTSFMRNLKDISQILYQFGLGAAALKVLKD